MSRSLNLTLRGIQTRPIVLAQKVTAGPSGPVPCGYGIPSTGGNNTINVAGVGGTEIRCGSTYPTATLNATQSTALSYAQSHSMSSLWNMLTAAGPPPLPITDVPAYTAYFTGVVTATNALGCTAFNVRNEPGSIAGPNPGQWGNAKVIAELNLAAPIIHGINSANIVAGPSYVGIGSTGSRNNRVLSQYIALGGLTPIDNFDFHLYQGGGSPEQCYVNEACYVESLVHAARPGLGLSISEWGGTFDSCATCTDVWGANQGIYMARSFLIYSCLNSVTRVNSFAVKDVGGPQGTYGIITGTGAARQPTFNIVQATLAHMNLFVARALYTDPAAVIFYHSAAFPPTDDIFGGNINTQPLFMRGTLADGNQRLFCWHASLEGVPAVIYVLASGPGTLKIQTINGSTATQAVTPGINTVNVTLGGTPKVLYCDDGTVLSFIQHSH